MKILLTYEDRTRKDSTGFYFHQAFKRLADVIHVHNEELSYINPKSFDLFVKIDDGLTLQSFRAKDFHPSVFYAIDTHIEAVDRIKMSEESAFDHIFCAQKKGAEMKWHTDNVHFLPLACDPNFHKVVGKRDKRWDLCFIGNVQPSWQKRRVDRLDLMFRKFPNFYFGNKFFLEMAEKFAESKLIFNSQYSDDINMRVFEALCSGSALFTEKLDWQELFIDDYHFISYASDEEMVSKAEYYLREDNLREDIAKRGQIEVLTKHTYLERARSILEKCKI